MSLNNMILIKEFRIPGSSDGREVKTIFGIYDLCVDMEYGILEISMADMIAITLREAIQKAQSIENEYGLWFVLFEECECDKCDPITKEYNKRMTKSWEGCHC